MVISDYPGINSRNKSFYLHANSRHVLMDTLLLTCHFLFEQKQLSLQRGPAGSSHGQWPFGTASGQSGSPSSPWSNNHHHHFPFTCPPPPHPTRYPGQDGVAGKGWSPSVPSVRGVPGAPVLRESAQASLGAPWWNELKGPSLNQQSQQSELARRISPPHRH